LGGGFWVFGFGGFGVGPQPPTPNPQSPIPNPQSRKYILIEIKYNIIYKKIYLKNKN